jgi:hypothetical protein
MLTTQRILALTLLVCSQVLAQDLSPACQYKKFPLFVGGDQEEGVSCIFTDDETGNLIFGGLSTSANFAPAENDHGYMVALD